MIQRARYLKKLFPFQAYPINHFSSSHSHSHADKPCGSCGGKNFLMRFICQGCHVLQNPETSFNKLNYFQVLNLPEKFEIDKKKLEQEFKHMQMYFHPDKVNTKPPGAQSYADEYSSTLNEAYSTLKNDFQRATYILELHGHKLEEGNRMDDFEFMEEILEKRMAIEESEDPQEISEYKSANDQIIENFKQDVAQKLENKEYADALKLIEKYQYFNRIDQAISDWEDRHKGH